MQRKILSLAAAALLLAACSRAGDGASSATSATSATDTASATTAPETTTTVPQTTTTLPNDVPRMPLTGVPLDGAEVPDRPALVVKISNAGPAIIPQSGLNQADIVFEEIINDASTRFAAVYHSQSADPVGPIRSGRHQDIDTLSVLNRPLYAWSGGNAYVTKQIGASDLVNMSVSNATGYYRRDGKTAPNNLYTTTDAIWAQAPAEAGRPGQIFPYVKEGETITGDEIDNFTLKLDALLVQWKYDPETNRYFRWESGSKHTTEDVDGVQQVWADNVVILFADYGTNPNDGNPEAQVLGSNAVVVMSGGKMRTGTWVRFEPTDPYALVTDIDSAEPLPLNPGRTWVEIPRNNLENLDLKPSNDPA